MVLRSTGEIEAVNGGRYQRLYIPAALAGDSQYPYRAGQGIRYQLVPTTGDRHVLVVVPDTLEVDVDASDLELTRSSAEVQTDLEEVEV